MAYRIVRDTFNMRDSLLNYSLINMIDQSDIIKKMLILALLIIVFYMLFRDIIHCDRVKLGVIHKEVKDEKNKN
jgi:hypothetical protein